jgi:predicted DNA repair protein MutK
MATGLIALLDDVAGIAKVAAASLDDVATQAAKAGVKAAGVVIDDAAVTPRYVVGFAAARELPIVRRIAVGSLRNKLLFLLPAALALGLFAPWAITPLLMLGGLFLCFEGAEKVAEALWPHGPAAAAGEVLAPGAAPEAATDPAALEDAKVRGAIRTDFILSAEIMAITLAAVPAEGFWMQAAVLATVGLGITVVVYGGVALIVKADDAGLALAGSRVAVLRPVGRLLVRGMPGFMRMLSVVGTAAMIWVGGGIVLHGAEELGLAGPAHAVHDAAHAAGRLGGAAAEWVVGAALAGVAGLVLGGVLAWAAGRAAMLRRG